MGTSGWSAERIALVRPLADAAGSGVVFIPNFSLGSVVGTALAAAAAALFDSVEIRRGAPRHQGRLAERHGGAHGGAHRRRPRRGRPARLSAPHVDQRARGQQVASVPVHSLRRPGVVARQEVLLSGPGETLSIVHDTVDPARAYAPGIRVALRAAPQVRGVVVGLESFLDLGLRTPGPAQEHLAPVDEGGASGQVAA